MYYIWNVGDKEYKLRLSARDLVDLEKRLGTNPLNLFMDMAQNEKVPSLTPLLQIIQASMSTFQHGTDMNKMYDIYDNFVANDGTLTDLIPVCLEIFKVSGIIKDKKEDEEEADSKN